MTSTYVALKKVNLFQIILWINIAYLPPPNKKKNLRPLPSGANPVGAARL